MSIQITSFRRSAAAVLIALAPLTAAAMASLTAAGQAAASERVHEGEDGAKALAVDFRDLRLADPNDVQALLGRLYAASELVCRAEAPASPMTLSARRTYRACVRAAMTRAVRAIGDSAVVTLYAGELPERDELR